MSGPTKRGRPTLPSALKVIKGTQKPSRINPHEPSGTPRMPPAPGWLSTAELAHFERIGGVVLAMRVLTKSDGEALGLLAAEYQKYLDCRADVEENGHVLDCETAAGTTTRKRNPASAIQSEAWRNVAMLMGHFGLTPSTRSSVDALPEAPADDPRSKWRK